MGIKVDAALATKAAGVLRELVRHQVDGLEKLGHRVAVEQHLVAIFAASKDTSAHAVEGGSLQPSRGHKADHTAEGVAVLVGRKPISGAVAGWASASKGVLQRSKLGINARKPQGEAMMHWAPWSCCERNWSSITLTLS